MQQLSCRRILPAKFCILSRYSGLTPERWPRRAARFWEEAPLFRPLLPLIVGICLYDRIGPSGSASIIWGTLLASFAGLAALLAVRRYSKWMSAFRALLFVLAFGSLGFAASAISDGRNRADFIGRGNLQSGAALLRVTAPPKASERIWTLRCEAVRTFGKEGAKPTSGGVILYIYRGDIAPPYAPGDLLMVRNNWQPISSASNPFGFDYGTFCRRQNFYFQQFASADEVMSAAINSDTGFIQQIHYSALRALRRYVEDPATLGILEAMLVGYEGDFDPELRQAYSETGVVHIVAISGSHVATLFLFFCWIPWVVRGRWGRALQYGLGLAAVWIYVLVAGAPPSAVRSAVVFSFLAAGVIFNQQGHTLNTLLGSVFAILCVQPMWVFAVGFQLSVAAVLSLLLFFPVIRDWFTPPTKLLRLLWDAGAASLAAQILVAPLAVYYFHNFPLMFFFANLCAWLMMGFCGLVGGLLILLFSWWPVAATLLAGLVTGLMSAFNVCVRFFQHLNPVSFRYLHLDAAETLLAYIAIAGFAVFLIRWRKAGLWAGGLALCLLLGLRCRDEWVTARGDRLVVYAISRHTVVERVRGRHYHTLYADTAAELRTPRDAHTGYGAWRAGDSAQSPVQRIGSLTVLVLDGDLNRFSGRFPVDALIVTRPLKGLSAQNLRETFTPKMLVVGGAEKQWRCEAWADSCRVIGQPFHATRLHGAYVME